MVWESVKADWTVRLPYRLRYNRYWGASRPCYGFWCVVYYLVKDALLLYLWGCWRFFKFWFWDILIWVRSRLWEGEEDDE